MYKYLTTLIFLLLTSLLTAQGWERVYYGLGNDEANAIAATPDGGFVMTGFYGGNKVHLLKTDIDGNLQWSKPFTQNSSAAGNAILTLADTAYIIAGYTEIEVPGIPPTFNRNILLVKTDASGNMLWSKNFGGAGTEEGTSIAQMPDGGFVVAGFNDNDDVVVLRTDAQGNMLWLNSYGLPNNKERANDVVVAANGDIVVAGSDFINPRTFFYGLRIQPDGTQVWANNWGYLANPGATDVAKAIVTTPDGGFLLAGSTNSIIGDNSFIIKIDGDGGDTPFWAEPYYNVDLNDIVSDRNGGGFFATGRFVSGSLDDLYMMHISATGGIIWDVNVGKAGTDAGYGIVATPDGGAAAAGYTYPFVNSNESSPYLVKADKNGIVFTSYVRGNVFNDLNADCILDGNENGLEDWIIKLSSTNFTRYIAADKFGDFSILVDTGAYELQLITPNGYWEVCDPALYFDVTDFYDTVYALVPVHPSVACTRNEIDIAAPVLRRCTDNTYTVRYCNSGTVPSFDTRVEVALDEQLSVTGSSIPWSLQQGQTYTFNVGTVNPGECKSFTVTAFLDCNNTITGETHCVTAHIFPDTFCNFGNWDGSRIFTTAVCENDTIKLKIGRMGGSTGTIKVDFVIAEDILMLTDPANPPAAFMEVFEPDTTVLSTPANGKTYRIIATNIENYNYPGTSFPTAAVEGCGTNASGGFSTGFYTMFPEDESDAFIASDCQESYETDYDSLYFKRGHPKGYDVAHYVSPETDLDFLIYFQNSGGDTVHQVIVRDTLSAALDPATVYPGASSHPYDFVVYGNGIVQFTIPNANLLPGGSSANTDGFVSFRVAQKPNQNCQTEILNTAAIYFDFNAPVHTNETYHTICDRDSFLIFTNTNNVLIQGAEVKVFPNPFAESAQFEITGIEAQHYSLDIFDIQGRHVFNRIYNTPTFRLLRQQIPPGAYIYRLSADGRPVASGKVIAGQ
ncbi:MAG: T9SS type A sorting domain-containing protein [Lewinellaceae bacterium]|nr:T9SS type A sorting domain-containing protein [Lewinellaceae bacterium]